MPAGRILIVHPSRRYLRVICAALAGWLRQIRRDDLRGRVMLDEADTLVQEAVTLAVVLARFFPRSQLRWQAIFTTLALGGRGVVMKEEKGGPKISSDVYPYFVKWAASDFDRKVRAALRGDYVSCHDDDTAEERFNREMRRYKKKRTQSLTQRL